MRRRYKLQVFQCKGALLRMSSRLSNSASRLLIIILAVCFVGGLALVTGLSHSQLVEAAGAGPATAHTNSFVPTAPLQSTEQSSIRQINLLANDLIVDPNTQTMYASVPSTAGSNGLALGTTSLTENFL